MTSRFELSRPLTRANFGGRLRFAGDIGAHRFVTAAESDPEALARALAESQGLLLLQGMEAMAEQPELLVRLSRVFGAEVENYRENLTAPNMVHDFVFCLVNEKLGQLLTEISYLSALLRPGR